MNITIKDGTQLEGSITISIVSDGKYRQNEIIKEADKLTDFFYKHISSGLYERLISDMLLQLPIATQRRLLEYYHKNKEVI